MTTPMSGKVLTYCDHTTTLRLFDTYARHFPGLPTGTDMAAPRASVKWTGPQRGRPRYAAPSGTADRVRACDPFRRLHEVGGQVGRARGEALQGCPRLQRRADASYLFPRHQELPEFDRTIEMLRNDPRPLERERLILASGRHRESTNR